MIELRRVAARFFNRPLLLTQDSAETIGAFLLARHLSPEARRGGGQESDSGETRQYFSPQLRADGSLEVYSPRASRFYGEYPKGADGRPLPFRRTADGAAIVTLVGEWVNRGAWVGASSGLISYEGFSFQMRQAAGDPQTRAIVLDLESPGGEAVGAFEAAALVREVATAKPVVAVVNGLAASAAYAIASGASRVVTIPTGLSGSIGVVLVHLDYSAFLKNEGIKPTLIFAGDHKIDGNPFEPLPKDVRSEMQAQVAAFYDQFVETVAVGRNMSPAAVIDTQARLFRGEDAVAVGLVDAVGTFESVLAEIHEIPRGRAVKGATMETKTAAGAESVAANNNAEAISAAAHAAKTRIQAILTAKEATGRGALANHLAFKTDMAAEDAVALLGVSAKEQTEVAGSRLDGRVPSPNVGDVEVVAKPQEIAARWDSVIAKVNKELAGSAGGRRI